MQLVVFLLSIKSYRIELGHKQVSVELSGTPGLLQLWFLKDLTLGLFCAFVYINEP